MTCNNLYEFVEFCKQKGVSLELTGKQHNFLCFLLENIDIVPISPKTKTIVGLVVSYKIKQK